MGINNPVFASGSDTQVQVNNSGALAGYSGFTFDKTGTLTTSVAVVSPIHQGATVQGGTSSGGNLTLKSTTHPTLGKILLGAAGNSAYDEVNDRLGIGTASPSAPFALSGTFAASGATGSQRSAAMSATFSSANTGTGNSAVSFSSAFTHTSGSTTIGSGLAGSISASGSGGTLTDGRVFNAASCSVGSGAIITALASFYANDAAGAGAVTTQYGFYCPALAKGGANYAFYSSGSTPSRFEGVVQVGGLKSSDGTAGATGTFDPSLVSTITVKNGMITGWS